MDTRAEKLAELVCDYSIGLKEGDRLMLQYDPVFTDYANLFVNEAKKIGASVVRDDLSYDPVHLRSLILRAKDSEIEAELSRRKEISAWCNTRVLIDCDSNPNYARDVLNGEERVAELIDKRLVGPYKEVLYRKGNHHGYEVRWNIVGFPEAGGAKDAGMSLSVFEDFVYSATIGTDWKKMSEDMGRLHPYFDGAKDVHIFVPGLTDLHLSLEGRGTEICGGWFNMPDGEFFYGPVENSANGEITYQVPSSREGYGVFKGIHLKFENGKVVGFDAKENKEGLEATLNIDEGARRIGELGIGCNYGIKKPILQTLFDEKIGGTIHTALGNSFRTQPLSEGGGLNQSQIHWDIVCDLRRDERNLQDFPGGWIKVDGTTVQENGEWKI
ncbi:aminopeptidase [Candidatus Pacearchaeota archaeon]|nr:aminopeptidase [Candidatus Pacearchaeota archaeon]